MASDTKKLYRVTCEPPKGAKVELDTRDGEERSAVRLYELEADSPKAARAQIERQELAIAQSLDEDATLDDMWSVVKTEAL